jgi:hypothetical protein
MMHNVCGKTIKGEGNVAAPAVLAFYLSQPDANYSCCTDSLKLQGLTKGLNECPIASHE